MLNRKQRVSADNVRLCLQESVISTNPHVCFDVGVSTIKTDLSVF